MWINLKIILSDFPAKKLCFFLIQKYCCEQKLYFWLIGYFFFFFQLGYCCKDSCLGPGMQAMTWHKASGWKMSSGTMFPPSLEKNDSVSLDFKWVSQILVLSLCWKFWRISASEVLPKIKGVCCVCVWAYVLHAHITCMCMHVICTQVNVSFTHVCSQCVCLGSFASPVCVWAHSVQWGYQLSWSWEPWRFVHFSGEVGCRLMLRKQPSLSFVVFESGSNMN